jgi:hypothetical protein
MQANKRHELLPARCFIGVFRISNLNRRIDARPRW